MTTNAVHEFWCPAATGGRCVCRGPFRPHISDDDVAPWRDWWERENPHGSVAIEIICSRPEGERAALIVSCMRAFANLPDSMVIDEHEWAERAIAAALHSANEAARGAEYNEGLVMAENADLRSALSTKEERTQAILADLEVAEARAVELHDARIALRDLQPRAMCECGEQIRELIADKETLEKGLSDNGCEIVTDTEGLVWVRNKRAEWAERVVRAAADTLSGPDVPCSDQPCTHRNCMAVRMLRAAL